MRSISGVSATALFITGLAGLARAAGPAAAPAAVPTPAAAHHARPAAAPTPVAAPVGPLFAPSKPAAENDALKMFAGNWSCDGTANVAPGKTAKLTATIKVKSDLDGFWQSYVYTEKKTKDYPHPITAVGTWGWDAAAKKLVRGEFQTGGGYATGSSTGWAGNTLTWELEVSNFLGEVPATHTLIKKGTKEFVHKMEVTLPGAHAPMIVFEMTCKK